jgi:hypothetical protein
MDVELSATVRAHVEIVDAWKSNASGSAVVSKVLRSTTTNSTFFRPAFAASSRAYPVASRERSMPTKRLRV